MTRQAPDTSELKKGAKAYSTPQLIEYGRVEEITGKGTSVPDLGGLQNLT
jgi:hypothetical protein